MEQLVKLVPLSSDILIYLAIDISIAVLLLFAIRSLSGMFTKISVRQELGEKDNFAFGISMAGRMLSLTIVLSAVVGRHTYLGFEGAALGMLLFGTIGILLVKFGRFAHDKVVLNRLDKDQMISEKNVSVALVDASSAVASAIIIKSIIDWADGADANTLIAILSGSMVVLAILLLTTRVYEQRYARNNQNNSFQKTLCKGQIALAIQHSGTLIGTAIVVSSAGSVIEYTPDAYVSNITGWFIVGTGFSLLLIVLSSIAKHIVLSGVNWKTEVDLQHNVGIASIEFVLSIGLAMLINGLFAS
ncbi:MULTISPECIES: DUF350 domain-containing protein [Alteromonadaceae]|jgi:uncharacterized membrane protein YjfL (UPF0719 family)|uniref:ATP synthase F0 subunit A n=1 Tax=Brumicola blandensis TaxID=3075611 RepID=A0AAW8R2F5_9ALTE|nr:MULTISPECIES: DUF350 domain-containing protein [unclassified Alteromonas]MDT0582614.1 hypothetical protein [Alteromonas sp. W409]MDT0627667.1 hypothetical protein [Alteromonas sp. W364]